MLQRAWHAGRKCKATSRSYCQVREKLTDSIGHTPAVGSLHIVSSKSATNKSTLRGGTFMNRVLLTVPSVSRCKALMIG